MLRNNNGYFLLELLLSLSAMFLICLYFIPLLIDLRQQTIGLEKEKAARQLMFEELQGKLNDTVDYRNQSFSQNGIVYEIYWKDLEGSSLKEVCVSAMGKTGRPEVEKCGKLE
ncbi:hypothetical protein [Neobacillus mesonae]|uniref:hypothetical protein n=1 Tax=Neobacillus mesonae TaxID=1193713 RepID=UPI00203FDC9A|nr:hypothetical protein [Neobacillus mesonae]MCM3566625.1 hypothetical protein [Neobacillus mesonae]